MTQLPPYGKFYPPNVRVHSTHDGYCVASCEQVWMEGVFKTPEIAVAWSKESPDRLHEAWKTMCPEPLEMPK